MDQHEFVRGCLAYYAEAGTDPEPGWQRAHYPVPECAGGQDTVWLTWEHHQVQGLLQSEEYGQQCFFNADALQFLSQNPTRLDLWDLYERWSGYNVKIMSAHPNSVEGRVKGGKAMNDHPNTKENRAKTGRVTGVINAERNLLPNCSSNGKSSSKKTNAQRWLCLATGHVSTPSGLSSWQIKRGIDTSLRKRLN